MSNLTDDEYTVLMIAAQGQSMIPIGRWEKPVRSLHAKGLLTKYNDTNYVGNNAGLAAIAVHEQGIDHDLTKTFEKTRQIGNAHTQTTQSIEQAALHLSFAAKASAIATGDKPADAVKKWLSSVESRALELVEQ